MLSSGFLPSQLQNNLLAILAPYTKTLHLDPNFVPFHLVSSDGEARLHQWQVIADGRIIHRFPSDQVRGGFSRARHDSFARVGGYYALNEMDDVSAEMAKSLAEYVASTSSSEVDQVHVRCVRYIDDASITASPIDDSGLESLYDANVWRTEAGNLNLLKTTEPFRSAPPAQSTNAVESDVD